MQQQMSSVLVDADREAFGVDHDPCVLAERLQRLDVVAAGPTVDLRIPHVHIQLVETQRAVVHPPTADVGTVNVQIVN
ncbi:hypothetical protein AB0I10_38845 [Streptomyces sp. NPDC050636]|uniref:hypothetical protein n=1 Tax=Streptomyces sp. NPDC050636 TaxID=3154510 RepID=UPI00342E7599